MTKGSVALLEYLGRHKLKKKENLPQREKRAKRVNLDFKEGRGLERKANLESLGPGGNLGRTARREKREAWAFLAIQGTQASQDCRALRERKVKLDFRAPQELL